MIFVTVGTHEQSFDRLLKQVDQLIKEKKIEDNVFMQIGYSDYEPKYTKWERLISFAEMKNLEEKADIIITHGGPATFMSVIAKGKTPIIVPRQVIYGEHVNDHQLEFARQVKQKGYEVEIVENVKDLEAAILKVKRTTKKVEQPSYNRQFVKQFRTIVESLLLPQH